MSDAKGAWGPQDLPCLQSRARSSTWSELAPEQGLGWLVSPSGKWGSFVSWLQGAGTKAQPPGEGLAGTQEPPGRLETCTPAPILKKLGLVLHTPNQQLSTALLRGRAWTPGWGH